MNPLQLKCDHCKKYYIPKDKNLKHIKRHMFHFCSKYCRYTSKSHRKVIHGKTNTSTFIIWCGMKKRCLNKNDRNYKNYGGRGITMCERWLEFQNFLEDMGERPDGKSLDRIDNNGNYCKENCKWSTRKEQNNNSRHNTYFTKDGETLSLKEWSDKLNIPYSRIIYRIMNGWTYEQAIFLKKHSLVNKMNTSSCSSIG